MVPRVADGGWNRAIAPGGMRSIKAEFAGCDISSAVGSLHMVLDLVYEADWRCGPPRFAGRLLTRGRIATRFADT